MYNEGVNFSRKFYAKPFNEVQKATSQIVDRSYLPYFNYLRFLFLIKSSKSLCVT